MSKHVIHKHSSQVVEGGAKLISPSDIEYGELALNYSKGYETLMFKNSQDEIVTMALSDIGGGGVGMSDPNSPSGTGEVFNSYLGSEAPNSALGAYSHAEGYNTAAEGGSSHAEGIQTRAIGTCSHAEGDSTIASGRGSHAEGLNSVATGTHSHAEGNLTSAIGDYSHAEGCQANANGMYSHAEGLNTIASESSSHAEGYMTIASGRYSHAEGMATTANRYTSHAEGGDTLADGNYSHAEGFKTIANGLYSHAEGFLTIASGRGSHAGGGTALAKGSYSFAYGEVSALSMYSVAFGVFNYPVSGSPVASPPRVGQSIGSAVTFFSLGAGTNSIKANALEIKNNGDMYIYGVGGYTGRNSPGMPTAGAQPIQEVLAKYTLILSATNYSLNNWAFVDGEGTVLERQTNNAGLNGLSDYLAKYSGVTAGIPDMTILMVQTSTSTPIMNKFRVTSFYPPNPLSALEYDIFFIDRMGANRNVRYFYDNGTLELL